MKKRSIVHFLQSLLLFAGGIFSFLDFSQIYG